LDLSTVQVGVNYYYYFYIHLLLLNRWKTRSSKTACERLWLCHCSADLLLDCLAGR
jgi:hypothetical protein